MQCVSYRPTVSFGNHLKLMLPNIMYGEFPLRSVGVANFNVSHLTELKKARPDNIPVGECSLSIP